MTTIALDCELLSQLRHSAGDGFSWDRKAKAVLVGEALVEVKERMSKSEFARQMGIRKQNVKALFKSKNLETIYKASLVMGVPFEMLVGYIEEPDPIPPYASYEEACDDFFQRMTFLPVILRRIDVKGRKSFCHFLITGKR